ncbi:MAG: phycobilisome linker polypeptide, partial [Cyanobacteria bacterium J06632_3]
SVLKTSNYQVRVPYSQMSQALRNINRQGGKVASVQLMGNPPVAAVNDVPKASASAPDADAQPEKSSKKASKRKRR